MDPKTKLLLEQENARRHCARCWNLLESGDLDPRQREEVWDDYIRGLAHRVAIADELERVE